MIRSHLNNLYILQTIYPTGSTQTNDFSISVNSVREIASACLGLSLIFNVFDPVTFKRWKNVDASGNNLFLSGSAAANCSPDRYYNFEFSYMDSISRYKMVRFMDSIPAGFYVVVRNIPSSVQTDNVYVNDWKKDTLVWGSNNSIYRLVRRGLADLDNFSVPRAFSFVYKKMIIHSRHNPNGPMEF
jgi:hypothetical protein